MKRDFKRLFSLMLVVAVLAVAFVFTAAPVAADASTPFTAGGQDHATLAAAADAAGENGTIVLNTSLDLSTQGALSLPTGVTLDLAGNTLTVDGLVGDFAGTNLIDSSRAYEANVTAFNSIKAMAVTGITAGGTS